MLRKIAVSLCLVSSLTLLGCAPRGETRTLDEVLASAKNRYQNVQTVSVPAEVAAALRDIEAKLEVLTSSSDDEMLRTQLFAAGGAIDKLILNAGYTSRPALGELRSQFQRLSAREQTIGGASEVRLLAARTYGALAAELETSRFSVTQ